MHWRTRLIIASVVSLLAVPLASPAVAQTSGESQSEGDDAEATATETASEEAESSGEDTSAEEKGEDEKRESEHGSYEYKRSYGAGIEYGGFFNGLDRWNQNVLEPNNGPTLGANALSSITLAVEASFLENTRLTAFAGFESPFSSNPSVGAIYGGLEPAFAFRSDMWELAIGLGVGVGKVNLDTDGSGSFETGVVTLRPAIEVRRYFGELAAVYARVGFNQWLPFSPEGDRLSIDTGNQENAGPNVLNEGGAFLSIGARIGHYPKHTKTVPDTDGDGIRDDVDDCVNEPEDKDQWKDFDGCPDPDNEGQDEATSDDSNDDG